MSSPSSLHDHAGDGWPGRWGRSIELDSRTSAFAREHLGAPSPAPHPQLAGVIPSRLTDEQCAQLFPGVKVSMREDVRGRYARGMSYLDLLIWRREEGNIQAPDAVLFPDSHELCAMAVEVCAREGIAVVPFGGGTSVTGGVNTPATSHEAVVAISTQRMNAIIDFDESSAIAHVGAGITGPQLQAALPAWTLGHFPQSWERASIGGFIAARSSGQASGGYGRVEDMVVSARLATPIGTWDVGGFPAASQGPDLRHLVLGSEGTLGVVTSAHLRMRKRPDFRDFGAAIIPGDFSAAAEVARELTRSPLRPTVMRVSDRAETAAMLAMSAPSGIAGRALAGYLRWRGARDGSLIILGWEHTRAATLAAARSYARDVLGEHSAVWLGAGPGRSWERGRFHGPYVRDSLMDAGYLVETFETVSSWSNLATLHQTVSTAAAEVLGENSYVMAHISHTYETGASLYFTVIAGGWSDPHISAQRWLEAKRMITDTMLAAGGAVSHHHGVGRDHRAWLSQQIGSIGVDVLQAVKTVVDPTGVMNPGALLEGMQR
jgi:alkyldihydroxyacetonephosphate synthase